MNAAVCAEVRETFFQKFHLLLKFFGSTKFRWRLPSYGLHSNSLEFILRCCHPTVFEDGASWVTSIPKKRFDTNEGFFPMTSTEHWNGNTKTLEIKTIFDNNLIHVLLGGFLSKIFFLIKLSAECNEGLRLKRFDENRQKMLYPACSIQTQKIRC
jgi:hypothetical protein